MRGSLVIATGESWDLQLSAFFTLSRAGVGVDSSGGHIAAIRTPRTRFARTEIVGRVPSEILDDDEEVVSESSAIADVDAQLARSGDGRST